MAADMEHGAQQGGPDHRPSSGTARPARSSCSSRASSPASATSTWCTASMSPGAHAGAVLEIDLGAIVANWRLLRDLHAPGPVAGVVKADGYGLGARRSRGHCTLPAAGTSSSPFWTRHGDPRRAGAGPMVAVLGGLAPGSEADAGAAVPVLRPRRGRRLGRRRRAAARQRSGDPACRYRHGAARPRCQRELGRCSRIMARLDGIALRYVMTHLACAEERGTSAERATGQPFRRSLRPAAARRRAASPIPPACSSARAAAPIWRGPAARSTASTRPRAAEPDAAGGDARRPGAAGPGVAAGDSGRLRRHLAPKRRAASPPLPRGYADGYLAPLGPGRAFFAGTPVPLVGRVSMDLTTFDVTEVPASCPATGWS